MIWYISAVAWPGFWGGRLQNGSPYPIGPLSVLSVLSCLWRWCIDAKRLDGSRWNLACRQASALATLCQMGTQVPLSQRGIAPPIFGPCLLFTNGWMDQDATWYGGRPQPKRYCVRWGPSSPPQKWGRATQFSADVYFGQTAAWIKIKLGIIRMEVGLGPGHIVLDGDPAPKGDCPRGPLRRGS